MVFLQADGKPLLSKENKAKKAEGLEMAK